MATESAYDVSTMPGGVDREIARLREQALMTWQREARNLKWWGLEDGMSVLDVGSGPGFVTAELLDMLPSSQVTGLEIDPVMIERADKYLAGKADGRLQSMLGSIMSSGLPDNSFDFAIARYVIQHLPDPAGAVSEILRILKPGGKFVVLDVDDAQHLWEPEDPPEVKAASERWREEHKEKGGDRYVGRKLLRILQKAGFKNCTMEAIVLHSDELGIERLLPPEEVTIPEYEAELQAGSITRREFELTIETDQKRRGPEGLIMLMVYMACGEK
ncbi:MAG: methyltransferase domain-containing protein [Chloroflexota bacterium]